MRETRTEMIETVKAAGARRGDAEVEALEVAWSKSNGQVELRLPATDDAPSEPLLTFAHPAALRNLARAIMRLYGNGPVQGDPADWQEEGGG